MLYKKIHRQYLRQFWIGRKFYHWGTLIEITDICIGNYSIGMICIDYCHDEWYSLIEIESGKLVLNNVYIKWAED